MIFLIYYHVIIMILSHSISSFFEEDDGVGVPKLYSFSYNMLLVCIHVSNLIVLIRHIDKAYQSLQILKKRILQDYQLTSDDYKRQNAFFLLQRLEMLNPMSGDGYFEITKTTMTSMISIRYISLSLRFLHF